jgi:DNA repair exonuclease SbcCD ATPase subunit
VYGICGVGFDITERKKTEEEREKLIKELQDALAEIKTLRGILPLCSFCKKIRDDKGYWEQVDVYIHKYSGADISHGICPDCIKEHYPEEYKSMSKKYEYMSKKRKKEDQDLFFL